MSTALTTAPESLPESARSAPVALPRCRADLVIRPAGKKDTYVIKSPSTGGYFQVGAAEHFLLAQLDGRETVETIRRSYEERYGEPLSNEDLSEFLTMANGMGLLESAEEAEARVQGRPLSSVANRFRLRQNILYFRRNLFDPDRLLSWLAPKMSFVWSVEFVAAVLVLVGIAGLVTWGSREELISRFSTVFSWKVLALFWVTVVVTMVLHEFAHGLTCKYFGGEVREIGVLVMFFTPCMYCNVSDAWLFSDKFKRIAVGLAGPFVDLCLWALATLIWRLTAQDSALNYVAWTVMAACGGRSILNFNPLMKSDGYYVLSDWMQIPNLSHHSMQYWMATARWLLWGAPRPPRIPRGRFILGFGLASWLFILVFLGAMVTGSMQLPKTMWGMLGFAFSLFVLAVMLLVAFGGIFTKEVRTMIKLRKIRTRIWIAALAILVLALAVVPLADRAGGTFQIRPGQRVEIRAPEAGFLGDLRLEEGSSVSADAVIATIHIPDLETSLRKKRAELKETQANLHMLEAGPRKEEIEEQRQRVARSENWCELARQNLVQAKEALKQDLIRLDGQIAQHQTELNFVQGVVAQARQLYEQKALAGQQLQAECKKAEIVASQLEQANAQKHAREATGTIEFEGELARREKELSDVRAALSLMEAGTRLEQLDAERARLDRLQEDLNYLEEMQKRVVLKSPVGGIVTTSRMRDKVGQYFEKGALICVIEDATRLEAEIALAEEDAAGVQPGQVVYLKARALPFRTFRSTVDRKAPSAVLHESRGQGTVTVYCQVSGTEAELLSGMTGFAKISRSTRPAGLVLANQTLRTLRTEFWW